jgi:hypothetical protein
MQPLRHKTLKPQQDHFGDTVNHKFVLPVSSLASAAVAFGLGAMIFTNGNTPADAANPQPTTTVTASPKPGDKAADVHETSTSATEAKADAAATQKATGAGSKGPFKDAQGDGKHLDDLGKAVMPNGLGVHVPDGLLPWHETYVDATESAQPAEAEDASDDVVSAPNVITDPDKPWFDLPTEAPADTPPSTTLSEEPEPAVSAPVVSGPVRNGGLVTGTRPVFNSVTGVVSSLLPE